MAAKSISTSAPKARSRRKPKSQTIYLSQFEIDYRARKKALAEIKAFMENWTVVERRIVGHLVPWDDPVGGMKEIRRLLGESIAKCKVIPFPMRGKLSREALS